jgi:hypothetical protein
MVHNVYYISVTLSQCFKKFLTHETITDTKVYFYLYLYQ